MKNAPAADVEASTRILSWAKINALYIESFAVFLLITSSRPSLYSLTALPCPNLKRDLA